ncbi:hypothetical protein CA223_00320 [Sphingomonas koreensis]|uniref:Uncharacterized protein n=1 Tax=Sphingomonas koreensis TaxID=93064 RepID=A0A1L6JF82_9SPHN|nr:hypothetical protein BRX40_21170 [Sphingomonas koreensis]RSU20431.1 hypothetical protein CA224_10140 [Sphingomonas koreensis]RSU28873.1 hypothetical protein CA225_09305 [Sphingomonas koreensis]RSU29613.1 hypothetical protein CA222_03120 [Sphingomonas koreensis]RSU36477.1 hypothetical protein BRX39_07370 [Sphingomonas koreensis]
MECRERPFAVGPRDPALWRGLTVAELLRVWVRRCRSVAWASAPLTLAERGDDAHCRTAAQPQGAAPDRGPAGTRAPQPGGAPGFAPGDNCRLWARSPTLRR